MNVKVKGYILGAAAAVSYGTNPLFAVPLYREGMTPDSVLFFRYMLAIPILGAMMWSRGMSFRLEGRAVVLVAVMGLLMAVSSYALFESYNYIDVGIASTLLFVYPIMVSLIGRVVFGVRLRRSMVGSMVGALVGVALLYNTGSGVTLNTVGALLAVGSGLSYAVYIVGVNRSVLKDMPSLKLTFYVLVFGISFFLVRVLISGELPMPSAEHWWAWGDVVGIAIFPTAISFLCATAAIHAIGSSPAAILGALEPVTGVVIGVCLFGELLTPMVALGMVLIIASVTVVVARL